MPKAGQAGFDYVIIGAGSAGCVLANRLSADPAVRVCLIEAGGRDNSILVRMPAGVANLMREKGAYNWGFMTAPQRHMDGRSLFWPRGKGWGGSSSINGMIYIRGHASDYDHWAQLGLKGWSYADLLPYFRGSQTLAGAGPDDPFHGADGPLHTENAPLPNPIDHAFIEAGRQAGHPYTPDFNGAQQEGVGPYQRTLKDGSRWSAAFAYLHPVLQRPNLTVISAGRVTRIITQNGRATGLAYARKPGSPETLVHADREVILCAGAVQSPQLLMLSGIGAPDALRRHGLPVVSALPEVGANLQDHLDVSVVHDCPLPITSYSAQKGLKKLTVGLDYMLRNKGPGRDNFLQTGAFLKSREGLEVPDLQFHFVLAKMIDHGQVQPDTDGITLHACQLRPHSRGTISLASADPFADPVIDPNYLAEEEDRRAMRQAVKISRDILGQSAMTPYRGREVLPGTGVVSDADIDAFVRARGETIYHPVSTVRMGVDPGAPVDEQMRVRGIEGLRVVDASVMPTLIGGNTNAPTIVIAEKAAEMISGRPSFSKTQSAMTASAA